MDGAAMSSEKEQIALALAVKQFRENLPAMLEIAELNAVNTRAKYLAFVKAGFTEQQALFLCKQP